MKRTMAPGKADDEGAKPKDKAAEIRAEQRERQWRRLVDGYRAVVSEMKRVTWPSREEWVSATLITVGLVAVVGIWTALIGWIVSKILGIQS